jgi:carboxypeptidase T
VPRRTAILTMLIIGVSFATAPTAAAATTDFPAGYEGYHTHAEVDTALDNAVANYGQGPNAIVKRYTIGQSFEGRNIWALKISDNAATDQNEPEVLSECGMHAREHITVEMCLYLIKLLTENYGETTALGQRVTNIVNSREIWIIPTVNPDGAEYDHLDGIWRGWRKTRQTNPGSDKLGIDPNRNWSYMWNCCGGSSGRPGSARYRGRFPFESVEVVVLRDFILSRRVGGQQQITAVLNWHSTGEFIMWPYGFTKEDIPPQMTVDDHKTFVAIGQAMAALNGYKPRQGSDSYIYDGDFPAWAYGDQRMFVYTFEMYPSFSCGKCGGFHPPDSVLARETTRNTEAVLYFLEKADCPYRVAGLNANCGPLYDNFETGRGWTFDPSGTDTATSGEWERGIPQGTSDAAGSKQRPNVVSGQQDLVTGAAAGGVAANDVDGGVTSTLSPDFHLGSGNWALRFSFTFAHDAAATSADYLRVSVVDGATVTPIWTAAGASANRNARWRQKSVSLNTWAGSTIQLLVQASDGGVDNVVEAAIDDVRVYQTDP